MFCTKCGKPTENNQPICNDCLQAMNGAQAQPQQQAYQQPQYQQPQYQQPYQAYQQPQYQPQYQPQQAYYAPQAPKAPALTKPTLGKAIAGLILASIAFAVLLYVYIYVESYSYLDYYYDYYYGYYYSYGFDYTWSLIVTILMLPPSIIGLTFGAKSIGGSNMVLADGTRKKHIATLILGIAALVMGITAVIMSGLSFYAISLWF